MYSKKLMTDELLCILYSNLHNYAYVDAMKSFPFSILISLAKKIMTFLDFFYLLTFIIIIIIIIAFSNICRHFGEVLYPSSEEKCSFKRRVGEKKVAENRQ